jgi:hypothetical protein
VRTLKVNTVQLNPALEKRRAARSRVLLGAQISDGQDGVSVECRVLNLSDYGALLIVSDAMPLPAHFKIRLRDKTYAAEVRWRDGPKIGVRFFVDSATETELAASQTARDLHEARVENAWLKGREKALLKRLAGLGYVEADEF